MESNFKNKRILLFQLKLYDIILDKIKNEALIKLIF
jgi:hypothetical protein